MTAQQVPSWLHSMPSGLVTEVSFYHSTQCSPEQAFVVECLSVLQQQCVLLSYELWISIHQNVGGQVETTLRTARKLDGVCVSIASVSKKHSASKGVVVVVNRHPVMSTSDATVLPWNSRA